MVRVSRLRSRAALLLSVSFLSLALAAWPLRSADLRPDYQPAAYAIKGAKIVADAGDDDRAGHGRHPRRA